MNLYLCSIELAPILSMDEGREEQQKEEKEEERGGGLNPEGLLTFLVCLEQDGTGSLVLSTLFCCMMVLWRRWRSLPATQSSLVRVLLSLWLQDWIQSSPCGSEIRRQKNTERKNINIQKTQKTHF